MSSMQETLGAKPRRRVEDNGTDLGDFKRGKLLGGGGFGSVYIGEHVRTHAKYALKQSSLSDASAISSLNAEAHALQALRHDHIITLSQVLQTETKLVLVEEYLDGGDLSHYIAKNGPMSVVKARRTFQQIVSAIHYCHQHNIAHCDLKPDNILLKGDIRHVKVADFGSSKRLWHSHTHCEEFCNTLSTVAALSAEASAASTPALNNTLPTGCYTSMSSCNASPSGTSVFPGSPTNLPMLSGTVNSASYASPKEDENDLIAGDLMALGAMLFFIIIGEYPTADAPTPIDDDTDIEFDRIEQADIRAIVEGLMNPIPQDRWSLADLMTTSWFRTDLDTTHLFPGLQARRSSCRNFLDFSRYAARSLPPEGGDHATTPVSATQSSAGISGGAVHSPTMSLHGGHSRDKGGHPLANSGSGFSPSPPSVFIAPNTNGNSSQGNNNVNLNSNTAANPRCSNNGMPHSPSRSSLNDHESYDSHMLQLAQPSNHTNTTDGNRSERADDDEDDEGPTDEEKAVIRHAFDAIDEDHNGYLTRDEIRDVLIRLRHGVRVEENDVERVLHLFGSPCSNASPGSLDDGLTPNPTNSSQPNSHFSRSPRSESTLDIQINQPGSHHQNNNNSNSNNHHHQQQEQRITYEVFYEAWVRRDILHNNEDVCREFNLDTLSHLHQRSESVEHNTMLNIRRAFDALDVAHLGCFTKENLVEAFRRANHQISDQEATELMDFLCSHYKVGEVSFDEFLSCVVERELLIKHPLGDQIAKVMNLMDVKQEQELDHAKHQGLTLHSTPADIIQTLMDRKLDIKCEAKKQHSEARDVVVENYIVSDSVEAARMGRAPCQLRLRVFPCSTTGYSVLRFCTVPGVPRLAFADFAGRILQMLSEQREQLLKDTAVKGEGEWM